MTHTIDDLPEADEALAELEYEAGEGEEDAYDYLAGDRICLRCETHFRGLDDHAYCPECADNRARWD